MSLIPNDDRHPFADTLPMERTQLIGPTWVPYCPVCGGIGGSDGTAVHANGCASDAVMVPASVAKQAQTGLRGRLVLCSRTRRPCPESCMQTAVCAACEPSARPDPYGPTGVEPQTHHSER